MDIKEKPLAVALVSSLLLMTVAVSGLCSCHNKHSSHEDNKVHNQHEVMHNHHGQLFNQYRPLHNQHGLMQNQHGPIHNQRGQMHNRHRPLYNQYGQGHYQYGLSRNQHGQAHNQYGQKHNQHGHKPPHNPYANHRLGWLLKDMDHKPVHEDQDEGPSPLFQPRSFYRHSGYQHYDSRDSHDRYYAPINNTNPLMMPHHNLRY
ncbi:hypothetical protein HF086_008325 [Spodoptera exigua]|uniref:Histidine-rich glycoprotein-like n=1 Tax=Spodoptera exigua TaxID=7107 RepID=A0A922M3C5_SPOEX|nr:hypothetical protein HF086_008325 [Spodoptera exigua]